MPGAVVRQFEHIDILGTDTGFFIGLPGSRIAFTQHGGFGNRRAGEFGTIGKAIREMNADKLKVLENRLNDYKQTISDRVHRKLFILDTEFHAAIIEMISNPILTDRYRDVCQKIFLRFRVEDLEIGRIAEIVKEHDALFDAVRIRDVDRAKGLIREHHASSRKNLFAIIFRNEIAGGKINLPKSSKS